MIVSHAVISVGCVGVSLSMNVSHAVGGVECEFECVGAIFLVSR